MARGFGAAALEDTAQPVQFTEGELAALFGMLGSDAGARSADLLGLDQFDSVEEARRLGFQSLIVRGLVTVQEARYVAAGIADTVAMIAGHANAWETAAFGGENVHTAMAVIMSEAGGLLVMVNPIGVHDVRPLRADVAPLELPRGICESLISQPGCEFPVLARVQRIDAGGSRELVGQAVDAETWQDADGSRLDADAFWAQ